MDMQKLFYALGDREREELYHILVSWKRAVVDPANAELSPDEIKLVQEERNIEAIKTVRCRLGLTLKAAKDVVDRYKDKRHPHWLTRYK